MSFDAHRCPNGHVTYPGHPRCPECGEAQTETIDISDETGEVVTWTKSTATPPGVREPNTMAIVEFEVDGEPVRALGQVTTDDVETGDEVEPVYVDELREPGAGIRNPESQEWDGYRFDPVQ
ncbi:nucleic acid-binding protein [Halostella sp. JP-L12]|uniref:Zn-ribbon domain-containing OB-fold protein n=1 Tax=Halostella TaxID=1843185 RepID=UPI000EF802BA|nr:MULTISPECIES: nucleic acid-binding protein [Halostella]NHN48905.1 nucleic acid-binding protein [Halostella sp. JP-L12]